MAANVSISEAKQRLGEIADRSLDGVQIVIVLGYFSDCYDKAAAKASRLGARSARKIVK